MSKSEGGPSSITRTLSGRFWVEAGLGLASTVFALFTLAWRKAAIASGAASA